MGSTHTGSHWGKAVAWIGAVGLFFGVSACNDNTADGSGFTPFERIAVLAVETNGDGSVDYAATYAKAQVVAKVVHNYIEGTDDTVAQNGGYPADWIVAGQETFDADPNTAEGILQIPSLDTIDPNDAGSGTYKVQVMDVCNAYYAKKALGVTAVVEATGEKVSNGFVHAPALPCEISVYNDGDGIYVDMLNPEAIFTLFFSDVVYGAQMDNADFADEMLKLPSAVKDELKSLVYKGLDGAGYSYTATSEPSGPTYFGADTTTGDNDVTAAIAAAPYDSPYLHFGYMKQDGAAFTAVEVSQIAQRIIDTMSINGTTVEGRAAGSHEAALESILSEGSSWRSARAAALGLPGLDGFKNLVIEACSPKYAIQALGTGRHHAPALPCEISVTALDRDGDGNEETLFVSFLEPGFMFTALFKDAFGSMSSEQLAAYEALPPTVLQDLQNIVSYALFSDLPAAATPIQLVPLGQLTYNMLPN